MKNPTMGNRRRKPLWKKVYKDRYLLLIMLPGALYLLLNNYFPMFGTLIAFKQINYADGIWGSPWNGLRNFEFLFSSSDAWLITRNTILYNIVFIVSGILFGVAFAIMLNELVQKLASKFYQSVMFLPYFLSAVIVGYLVFSLLSPDYGYLNNLLSKLFGAEAINWYGEAKYWVYILPIVHLWKNIGYGTVIYLAAIVGIDEEYYEAAIIDGATKWQRITRITIPLIQPVILILFLLSIGRILNADFGLFYQVTLDAGALYPTTNVIDTYVYRALLKTGEMGMSSAAGLYQAVVGFVVVLGANALVRKINKENALF